ncbi:MAG TPA: DUF4349 domain-containing protein [Actinomycetes bacterium]|nr:DUF4349 domain-containing protein [Actinomycetes bacterium]
MDSLQDKAAPDYAAATPEARAADQAGTGTDPAMQLTSIERQVIATADVTIRVDDVESALPELIRAATSVGGYVAGEDTSANPDDPSKTQSTLVLRVPTGDLERVVRDVSGMGDVIRSRQDVQDVTQQVVDVRSRVASARASVSRIRVLLDQATTLGQVVRIESQLSRREADLEALLATQRSLADQTEMATLTVTALGPEAVAPPKEDDKGFVAGLSRGWDAFIGAVVVALTAIGLLLPFAILLALLAVPVWYFRDRLPRRHRVVGSGVVDG